MEQAGGGIGGEHITIFHHFAQKGPISSVDTVTPGFLIDVDALKFWPTEGLEVTVDDMALELPGFKGSRGQFWTASSASQDIYHKTGGVVAVSNDHVTNGSFQVRSGFDHVFV